MSNTDIVLVQTTSPIFFFIIRFWASFFLFISVLCLFSDFWMSFVRYKCNINMFYKCVSEIGFYLFLSEYFFVWSSGLWAAAWRRRRIRITGARPTIHVRHSAVHWQHCQRHCSDVGSATFLPSVGTLSSGHRRATCQVMVRNHLRPSYSF